MIYDFAATASAAISTLGVIVALGYFLLGIDDLACDAFFWLRMFVRRLSRRHPRLTLAELRDAPQSRVAIFVPCWHEAAVIGRVLGHACERIEYDNYEILVGVYPNDPETIAEVERVGERFPQVRAIINHTPGPTTKGQNLNAIFAGMRQTENDRPFEIVVMHDAEDMVHPYELLIYNRLIPRKAMVQLPVFPLEFGVGKWTGWTYADEFVEAHLKDVPLREMLGAFVPSAGTGCGFDRHALEKLGAVGDVFPNDTLTEDYIMGMRLGLRGSATVFVHQLLRDAGDRCTFIRASSYVATRAFFPDSARTAIRQKRRWITGICFQAWASVGWTGTLANRYALYRDRRGIFGNPLLLVGYALLLCGLGLYAWHALDDQIALPTAGTNRIVWALFDTVLVMTLLRLAQKSFFVASMYGPLQGFLCLLRVPWAGWINGIATLGAARAFFSARLRGQQPLWVKTTHVFPSDEELRKAVR